MPHARQILGSQGEDAAQQWYVDRGYQVVARNWYGKSGELDLVVYGPVGSPVSGTASGTVGGTASGRATRPQLVFCEVKTRTTDQFGTGFEAVTADKQRRIRRLAVEFLQQAHQDGTSFGAASSNPRFDVVSIVAGKIEVIQAAF